MYDVKQFDPGEWSSPPLEGRLVQQEGLGGKTVLGHRAVAKIDMRLVPDIKAQGTLELLRKQLQKHGFGDIEVNMSGG